MTYNGSLFAEIELLPLILIEVADPGAEEVAIACRPEIFPFNAWSSRRVGIEFNSADLIEDTEPVKSLFFTDP